MKIIVEIETPEGIDLKPIDISTAIWADLQSELDIINVKPSQIKVTALPPTAIVVEEVKWIEGNEPKEYGYYYVMAIDGVTVSYYYMIEAEWESYSKHNITHYAPIKLPSPPKI